MTDDNLPPLPDWMYRDDLGHRVPSDIRSAMNAYARAAILAERDRFRAMFDEALSDHSITWPGEVDILYEKMFPAAAIREGVK